MAAQQSIADVISRGLESDPKISKIVFDSVGKETVQVSSRGRLLLRRGAWIGRSWQWQFDEPNWLHFLPKAKTAVFTDLEKFCHADHLCGYYSKGWVNTLELSTGFSPALDEVHYYTPSQATSVIRELAQFRRIETLVLRDVSLRGGIDVPAMVEVLPLLQNLGMHFKNPISGIRDPILSSVLRNPSSTVNSHLRLTFRSWYWQKNESWLKMARLEAGLPTNTAPQNSHAPLDWNISHEFKALVAGKFDSLWSVTEEIGNSILGRPGRFDITVNARLLVTA